MYKIFLACFYISQKYHFSVLTFAAIWRFLSLGLKHVWVSNGTRLYQWKIMLRKQSKQEV